MGKILNFYQNSRVSPTIFDQKLGFKKIYYLIMAYRPTDGLAKW